MLSFAVHVASLFGVALFGKAAFALHVGIFVVWIPMVFVVKPSARLNRKAFWKRALQRCPSWMRTLTYGSFVYALVNFAYFFVTTAIRRTSHSGAADAVALRGFSGHWMYFYSAAMSVIYSRARPSSRDSRNSLPAPR